MTSVQAELCSTRLGAEPNTLFHALDAHERGWSVIPLRGGKHRVSGKQPRGAWHQCQKQQATEQQLRRWFANGCSAYGVICGAVSNLIVIDFDDVAVQAEFIKRFPHLMNTRIVQSGLRGTLHIYLKTDFPVKTQKLRGGDLKAEGSYVVGAGSQIAGGVWKVIKDCPLYAISQDELDAVIASFSLAQLPSFDLANVQERMGTPDTCIRTYQLLVDQLGSRNEALFRTSCSMRDAGYGLADVMPLLTSVHARQHPVGQHHRETEQQRYAEAERTLHSVFSRPPRPRCQNVMPRQAASYVANSLRERILMYPSGVSFLRVYEGLRLVGKSAGDSITEGEVVALLSPYGIGRPTVRQALQFTVSPAPRPSPHADADITILDNSPKTCVFVPETSGDKKRGRPARRYLMPSVEQLCKIFNVRPKGSDPIALPDIRSAQSYRAALNRELIQRRPGKYSQKWLGKRLNVSKRTIQRYLKRENIQSRQLLEATPIEWGNVNQIPTRYTAKRAGFDIQRYFLQDEQGRRYPPKPEIASKLLKQHHLVWLMKRSCNVYWCDPQPCHHIGSATDDANCGIRVWLCPG
ncbi:MAG: bifunctional DNA primase/polymerase [Chloroflexi bacterium]|nr:bifunctional DNA primase/polymerase [Chloroflexota bacterium]